MHGKSGDANLPSVILDTDMGNDVDDALALGMLHRLASRGECTIRAVTVCKGSIYAACFVDAINAFYGRPDLPVGWAPDAPTMEPGPFVEVLANLRDGWGRLVYPRRRFEIDPPPEAVTVLREQLAQAADGSVVLVTIGFFTNLARLLDSEPDEISPLSGGALMERKVSRVVSMAGDFARPEAAEYNVKVDVESTRRFVDGVPVEMVFSGWEIGMAIPYPAESITRDYGWTPCHPVVDAYHLYKDMPYDRPSWDLTAVLYAVRPEAGYFGVSAPGRVRVEGMGTTAWEAAEEGVHRYLTVTESQAARVGGLFEGLCSERVGG